MSIQGIGANTPVNKIVSQPISKQLPAEPVKQIKLTDKVQLSGVSHLLATLKAGGDIRADKVAVIKQQIEAGTYETGAKIDATLDRVMDDLSR
ncbi:MAG: flagellar biosynthesis anti-sigma factor FlgM [Tepidisphaeraceae bacterium]